MRVFHPFRRPNLLRCGVAAVTIRGPLRRPVRGV